MESAFRIDQNTQPLKDKDQESGALQTLDRRTKRSWLPEIVLGNSAPLLAHSSFLSNRFDLEKSYVENKTCISFFSAVLFDLLNKPI
jgi:hypothetical protein